MTGSLRADASPESIAHALLLFRLFFITLTMTSIGLVALVIWDGVYPDRRDARILTPLPVPGRTLIGARLLALAALCGIFVVGINAVPSLLYAPTITHFGGASNQVRGLLAFVIANGLAGTFVFSALVTLQGIALNVGGKRATDRLSVAMQILFIAALLQMIFLMPRVATMLPTDLASGAARAMPSVWFLGLYDVIGGRPAAGAPFLAAIALAATAATVGGSILLFVVTHARLTKRALEAKEGSSRERRLLSLNRAGDLFASATTRAVFLFTLRSLSRSRSHRLLVAMYVGGATALVVSALLPVIVRDGLSGFTKPSLELLSAPLVMTFWTLIGLRVAMAIPIEPKANWVFRLGEPADRMAALDGMRGAMIVVGVLPAALFAFVTAITLWGVWAAAAHTAICSMMGWALVEVLMMGVRKMPFTCTYFPGNSRVGTLWPFYLTGFITFAYTTAAWEASFLYRPVSVLTFLAILAGVTAFLTIRRRFALRALTGLRFQEEDPAALFKGFDLSEGFAARAVRKAPQVD